MTAATSALDRIALSLSGGGYRAAAFHLGTLELLHRVGLLERVRAVSTVSGGTIVGARYALSLLRGEPFEAFFRDFSSALLRTNVVSEALHGLGRRRSIITAAAEVYAGSEFFGDVRFGELLASRTHVREWIFNATEFHGGIAFRFQASRTGARIGNGNYWMSPELAARIRLADIVAASSCFPGAFEPLVFPHDFVWPEDGLNEAALRDGVSADFPSELALMDGGIFDNQGIDALLLAEKRAGEGEAFELFLVSDSHRSASQFLSPQLPSEPGGMRLRTLMRFAELAIGAAGVGALLLGVDTVRHVSRLDVLDVVLRMGAVAALLGFTGGSAAAWTWLRRELELQLPEMSHALWRMLGELRTREAMRLLNVRVRSLLAMVSDVFMKRVRGLSYERLYREVGADRTVTNLIYDVATAAKRQRPGLVPSEQQRALVARVNAVKTALWLERGEEDLRDLIACGQNTLCLNLLEHLRDHYGEDCEGAPSDVRRLRERLEAIWQELGADPYALVARPAPVKTAAA